MALPPDTPLLACHECDQLAPRVPISSGGRASCSRCGGQLYRHHKNSLDRALALYLSAAVLFVIANGWTFLTLKFGERFEANLVASGARALVESGMPELALLVFFTSVAAPGMLIAAMLYLLIPLKLGRRPAAIGSVWRLAERIAPWSLIGVFMLAALIAFVKLQDLAEVLPGIALFSLTAMMLVLGAARAQFDPELLWQSSPVAHLTVGQWQQLRVQHAQPRLFSCHGCGLLCPQPQESGADTHMHCPRCGETLHHRRIDSLQRTWALVAAATVLLIPANFFPVMTIKQLGQGQPDTIMSGVLKLIESGMWGLAMIVFIASFVVPILKLVTLAFLCLSVQMGVQWRPRDRTLLYRITEAVGAWSMVDVFLVAVLTGLVSLSTLADVDPGIGASFFAGAVVLTMFAAMSFDARLIWDGQRRE